MKVRLECSKLSNWMHLMLLHQLRKHLLFSPQMDNVSSRCPAGSYQPPYRLLPTWKRVQPGLTRAAQHPDLEPSVLSKDGDTSGHPKEQKLATCYSKPPSAKALQAALPKICLCTLVWGWRSPRRPVSRWPLCRQLQPEEVVGQDPRGYVRSPGSRCTVNKTVFPTEPAE